MRSPPPTRSSGWPSVEEKTARRAIAGLAIIIFTLAVPGPARACTPPRCWGGFVMPDAGTIPPGQREFAYWPRYCSDRGPVTVQPEISATTEKGRQTVVLRTHPPIEWGEPWSISLLDGVPEGATTLTIWIPMEPGWERWANLNYPPSWVGHVVEVNTAPSRAVPDGTISVRAPQFGVLQVATWSGTCSKTVPSVYVDLELPDFLREAERLPAFSFQTFVDGKLWSPMQQLGDDLHPGRSWQGAARDRVFALCGGTAERAVSPGEHTARFVVRDAAGAIVRVSETAQFTLQCP
jgi:hypothetical protein